MNRAPPPLLPLVLAAIVAQALIVVLAPMLVAVARDLDASPAAVSQARIVAAVAAIAASAVAAGLLRRGEIARPLHVGSLVAVAGCGAAAAAPSVGVFLATHALLGAAVGLLASGAFAGVAAFPPAARRTAMGRVVAANAAAWIIVNPITGALTDAVSWRAGQLVPAVLATAVLATAGRAGRVDADEVAGSAAAALWRDVGARRWVLAEWIAYCGWAAELTFVGAFFVERHGLGEASTGVLLAIGAAVFVVTSTQSGRITARLPRRQLIAAAALAMAAFIALQMHVAPSAAFTLAAFCLVAVAAGVRSPASASLGLAHCAERPGAMMAARSAAMQGGYLGGAAIGGAVLAASGYAALGTALAIVLVAAAVLAIRVPDPEEAPRPSAAGAPGAAA